jgi:hypothetical protein
MTSKYTKWPWNIPKGFKISQWPLYLYICIYIVYSKALQNVTNLWYLVWKYTIWQPWCKCWIIHSRVQSVGNTEIIVFRANLLDHRSEGENLEVKFTVSALFFRMLYICMQKRTIKSFMAWKCSVTLEILQSRYCLRHWNKLSINDINDYCFSSFKIFTNRTRRPSFGLKLSRSNV